MINSIIFDLGGVLYLEERANIIQEIASYAGVTLRDLEDVVGKFRSLVTKGNLRLIGLYEKVVNILRLNRTPEELLQKHLEAYNANALIQNPKIDSLITILKRNYLIACLTNTEPEIGESNRRNGIFDRFKPYDFLSTELRLRKPMPEIYIEVLRRVNSKSSETVFIDDNISNVQGAQSVGIHAICFNNTDQLKRELESMHVIFSID